MPPLSPALADESPAALVCLLFFYLLYCVLRPTTGARALGHGLRSATSYPKLHADVIATAGIIATIRNRLGRSRNRDKP
jgi:hypothetical protein